MLVVHANLIFILSEFLPEVELTSQPKTESQTNQVFIESDDDEVDLAKTQETIWSLLTGDYQSVL